MFSYCTAFSKHFCMKSIKWLLNACLNLISKKKCSRYKATTGSGLGFNFNILTQAMGYSLVSCRDFCKNRKSLLNKKTTKN